MPLQKVELTQFTPEIFKTFESDPPLLTAGDRDGCNTMTIGWCQLGRLWSLPVCTVYVRPSRHTYNYIERANYFTVSSLPESMRKTVAYCGKVSGRDTDKFKDCGLTLAYGAGDAPYLEEAEWVLVCKKLYAQDVTPACLTDSGPVARHYAQGDWHRAYIGEVVEVYKR